MADIYFDVDTALAEVPVNIFPLTDDTDFKTRETSVAYNATGMDLVWNFVTTAGAYTQTAVTPTTGGAYDWAHIGDGMYTIEIPASGGASINNDTEGFGWFTGMATGVLPWRSPVFGFRAAALNNALIDGGDLLDVNVTHIADTAQTGRDVGASVLLSAGTGTGQVSLSSGAVTVGTNNDKTGYTASTVSDKTGYSLSAGGVTAVQSGLSTLTAQQVWEYATRTLSTFGSLVADTATAVWGAVARTITGGTITTVSDKTGYSISGTKQTLDALNDFDHSTDIVAHVTLTDTCTTNTDMRGTNSALLASGYTAPDNASITSIKGKTDQLTFTTPNSVDATATVSTAGLATEANQTTIINHLTDVKGATFSGSTDSLEAIRNRGDVAWITGGTGGGSNAVTINVKDDNAANVVDCYVEIWDSAGTSLISRTNTNSSGNVTFGLDTNTYIVKMHKTGYYFENQTMEVGHDETFPYTGTILTPDAATNPTLCRIYGYYFDPAGSTYSAVKSLIKLTAIYEASDNNYYTSEFVGTYNTTTGLLYFDVIQGASVTLEIPILNVKKSFVVPATTLYKISDIA